MRGAATHAVEDHGMCKYVHGQNGNISAETHSSITFAHHGYRQTAQACPNPGALLHRRMKESNIPLTTLAARLALPGLCDLGGTLNSRVALSQRKAPDRNELIVAHYGANMSLPVVPLLQAYGELCLAQESILAKNLPQQFEQAANSTSFEVLKGFPVEVNNTASIELVASDGLGSVPRYLIELATPHRGHLSSAGPLIVYGQPAFETQEQAVRAWVPLRPFHNNDSRLGSILIEVPLAGPRLGGLSLENDGSLRVTVEGRSDTMPIELSGVWHSSEGNLIETFTSPITGDSVVIARPATGDQVAMWLVRKDSLVTDFFIENPNRCTRKQRVLFQQHATTAEDYPTAQIDAGEGEITELKPFIKLSSDKIDEVVRTVVAFANTRGGTIFIGVNDYGEVDGIDKDLWDATPKNERKSLDECAKNYCAEVRKKVLDRVSVMTAVRADIIQVRDKMVVRIRVEEAGRKPCSDVSRNEFWIRKGSNTRRPDTEQLRGLMIERNSFSSAFE
jgi:Putative DNA-binding domain